MNSLSPITALAHLSTPSVQAPVSGPTSGATTTSGFGRVLSDILGNNANAVQASDKAIQDMVSGEAEDLHTVSLAVAKADLSFRLVLELRNKLTEAYQEVMRMQV
jgi:flagellar hook-basal body complex protein FliE